MDTTMPMIGDNSAIAAYSEFRAQLGELREFNAKAVFDYADPRGNKDARSHIYKLRQTKAAVEKVRKEEKSVSLEYGRRVDEQAKEIVSEIETMIEVHAKPLEEIEQHEKDRIERHERNLREIQEAGHHATEHWMDFPLEAVRDRLAEIEAEPIDEAYWEEFALRAAQTKDSAVASMRDAIAKREKQDSEQAELERLRIEADERQRLDREEKIRVEARQRAAEEAEQAASQERERAETEATAAREAAERRELELKLAAEKAERQKVEAEQRAANAAKDAEERLRREATEKAEREAAETAKREADKKHRAAINRDAVAAFVKGGLAEEPAKQAVTLIAQKAIPQIQIFY